MNWSRVWTYALIGALMGALIGGGLAMYSDSKWLSPDIEALLLHNRVRRTRPNGSTEHRQPEADLASSSGQES